MPSLPRVTLRHVGIFVTDFETMLAFYRRLFGLRVSDQTTYDDGRQVAFLTGDGHAHHTFVMSSGRPADSPSTINQISFYAETLDDVRQYWYAIEKEPLITRKYATTHGNAWSVYFWDPEGNRVEVYTDAPWHIQQPAGHEIDFTQSDEEILRVTEAYVNTRPERKPIEEFYAETAKALEEGD